MAKKSSGKAAEKSTEDFEGMLWKTADKLRKNIDAAEYTRPISSRRR